MLSAVLMATTLVYLRSVGNGFVFDDEAGLIENRYIGNWSFLWKSLVNDSWWYLNPSAVPQSSYYRPLQNIWYAIHYHLFGLSAAPWHATMLVLHAAVVWLVFKLARRLCGSSHTALLASLMFGMMPIHAEAVVWASAIPLPLVALCELGAFYLFITRSGAQSDRLRNWLPPLLLYAGALLSHESAVTFPAIVAVYAHLFEAPPAAASRGEGTISRRGIGSALVVAAPFAFELLIYFFIRWLVLGFIARPNPLNHATTAQVMLTIPSIVATDLLLLAMPWTAGPSHRVLLVKDVSGFYLPATGLLAAAAVFLAIVRNSPRRPLYLFCAVWIGATIAPMMNLKGLFQQELVQDRYLYVASVGWCLMIADCVVRLADRRVPERNIVWAGAAALVISYAIALWNVQRYWHDDFALYSGCVERFPESSIWRRLLASTLERRGDLKAAEQQLEESFKIDPTDAKTLYRLAVVHMQLGRINDAAREAADSLRLNPHPLPAEYILLARLYDAQGDLADKEAVLKRAEAQPGGRRVAGVARAQMMMAHGDARGAEKVAGAVTRDYPNEALGWVQFGLALAAQKRFDEALTAFQRVLDIAPNDQSARILSAQVLHQMGRDVEAIEQCRLALASAPDDANARTLMAQLERGPSPR